MTKTEKQERENGTIRSGLSKERRAREVRKDDMNDR